MNLDELKTLALQHRYFVSSKKDAKVLQTLAEHPGTSEKAKQNRINALEIEHCGGNRTAVSSTIFRVKTRLKKVFNSPELRHTAEFLDVVVAKRGDRPPDLYELQVKPRDSKARIPSLGTPPTPRPSQSATAPKVKRNELPGPNEKDRRKLKGDFWKPFANTAIRTWVIYGTPMFLHEPGTEKFVRFNRTNTRKQAKAPLKAVYPFLRLGEVRCMLDLTRFFAEHGIPLHWHGCKSGHGFEHLVAAVGKEKTQIILLGNAFSNGILVAYQDYDVFRFRIDDDQIVRTAVRSKRVEKCYGQRQHPRVSDGFFAYGLLSRRRGLDPDTFVTTIASDNGRVISKIGEVLCRESRPTDESIRAALPKRLARGFAQGFPDEFQLVFEVGVYDGGDTAVDYRIVDGWIG